MPFFSSEELQLPRRNGEDQLTNDNSWHTLPLPNGGHRNVFGMMGDQSQAQLFYWLGFFTRGWALEMGTFQGYSAILFALGMKHSPWQEGKLICVDNYAKGFQGQDALPIFQENIKAFDVEKYITLKQCSCEDPEAISWLDEPLEWVYQDASHVEREISINWDIYYPLIKPGGLWIIHDTHQEDPPRFMRKKQQELGIIPVVIDRPDFEVWMKPVES